MRVLINRLMYLLPLIALTGCAASYNCYENGKVNCSYCPPNPLPYSICQSCNCCDSKGRDYFANVSASDEIKIAPAKTTNSTNQGFVMPEPEK